MRTLEQVVAESAVVICCGSGGVGKTTTAAVVAMRAARAGRRAVVVTIDPARRLADALGLEGLTNTPSRIDGVTSTDGRGEMWAMMLDTKATFDGDAQFSATFGAGLKVNASRNVGMKVEGSHMSGP